MLAKHSQIRQMVLPCSCIKHSYLLSGSGAGSWPFFRFSRRRSMEECWYTGSCLECGTCSLERYV